VVRPQAGLAALAEVHDRRALATVVEYLAADDPWVRRAAIEAAEALLDADDADGRAVEPILRALDRAHARKAERVALVTLLGKTGSPRAVPTLAAFARDKADPALRLSAVTALGRIGHGTDETVLVRALDDEYGAIRLAAALALRRSAGAKTAEVLLDRFERAAEQDRGAVLLALSGALGVTTDSKIVGRVERLISSSDGEDRDRLLEGLGRVAGVLGSAALVRFIDKGVDAPTRSKIAEALATHTEGLPTLERLARDPDASVRANAVWAMGSMAPRSALSAIAVALGDSDPSVAGNAAAAVGRLGLRGAASAPALCGALGNAFPYVRANALSGLAAMGVRCSPDPARALLASDPSEIVRAAAARLIARVKANDPEKDRTALARCAEDDSSGDVVADCVGAPGAPSGRTADVSIYVVATGDTEPTPQSPFALVRADGLTRLGVTDRAGSVYEHDAPRGVVRLGIPAPLVF
jgi:HEAT repeat protein